MPIRVNLKELFPSDSQEITIDKVNFNFNKLLELGIGDQGVQGLSGIQGPAGPTGLVGPAGLRGSTWFVDAGDPNTLTGFGDLIDNDLYLDSNLFDVWQYDAATDSWSLVTSISNIVNNYLSTTPSPFRRGLGLSSPQDERFITFNRRGNTYLDTQLDVNLGTLNTANSDTLFLNNFNEDVLTSALSNFSFTAVPGELFNSLLSIYTNHSEGASALQGRYHLEMGALYENTEVSPSQVEMSELRHNLKVKFLKEDVSLTTTLTNTNYWINTARFSLGKLEAAPVGTIDQNGRFEFVVPKYNNEGMSPVQTETTIRFGSAESLIEQSAVPTIVPDGISISSAANGVIFGIKEGLETILNLPYSAGNADFALFDVSSGLDGFFFNDRIVQSDGNIEQIHTTPATFVSKIVNGVTEDANVNKYYSSIFSNGKYLITTFPGTVAVYGGTLYHGNRGFLSIRELDSELTLLHGITSDSQYSSLAPPTAVDNHGHYIDAQYAAIPLTGVTDVAMCGKYMYITKIMPNTFLLPPLGLDRDSTTFIVAEMDSDGNNLIPVGLMDFPSPPTAFRSLQRVKVIGSIAYVINKREPASPWSVNNSTLNSIDISDPTNPTLLDTVGSPTGNGRFDDNYLDLEIFGERAFVSTYTESDNSIRIKRFDIHNPSVLRYVPTANPGEIVVVSGATEKPAQLEIQGTWLFCSYDNDVYIYDVSVDNTDPLTTITSLQVDPDIEITDIKVNGKYLYVLGENKLNLKGMLATVDISDIQNPFVVAIESRSDITAPGKMTLVGNKIYVASSQGTGTYSAVDGGISTFEIDGIISPAANISSVRSEVMKVSKSVQIGESLDVGNSVNVGQGGLYVDRGQGISTDGPVKIRYSGPIIDKSVSFATNTLIPAFNIDISQVNQTSSSGTTTVGISTIRLSDVNFDDSTSLSRTLIEGTNEFDAVVYLDRMSIGGADYGGTGGSNTFNGEVYGLYLLTGGASINDFNSTFYGVAQTFGNFGDTTTFNGLFIGNTVNLGDGVTTNGEARGYDVYVETNAQVNNSLYAYKFNFDGDSNGGDLWGLNIDYTGATIANTAWGIDVTGADKNRLEGQLLINDHPHELLNNVTYPSEFSGSNQFVSGRFDSAATDYVFTRVGDVVTCTGSTTNAVINIPLGTIASSQAWGVASWNNGGGGGGNNVACRVQYRAADAVEIFTANGGLIGTSGTMWFTFSYVVA